MNGFWKGAFAPRLTKHRDYCGDISNHLEIKGQEIAEINLDKEVALVVVSVGFVGSSEEVYEYEVFVELGEAVGHYDTAVDLEVTGAVSSINNDVLKREVIKQIESNWK